MPEKVIHEIRLNQYSAVPADRTRRFSLGTKDSYGIEQLRIVPGEGWDGLTITATFHPPEGEAVQVLVPADGLIDVPPEATRSGSELPLKYGKIVFAGVADGMQRISCNLPYTVLDHAPVEGAESSGPAPSWYEQAAAHFLPGGGKAGQVLAKASAADLDVEWADGGGSGTSDHAKLSNRDAADQHPISAITGLETALDAKQPAGSYLTQESDPTVPDWAKQPEKPSYTADEVGALSAATLPEAITTALAQATASGAFDGADGQDGITPTIGDNGNWYLGETDTGKPSRGETGPAGADGRDGADGQPGENGTDGYSPTANVTQTDNGATITITDKNGTTTATVTNGKDGADGIPGKDGAPGADGKDGITPTIGENGNWYLGSTDTGKPSRGEAGAQGPSGADGKSAYAYAVDGGYTGTEAEFAAKLAQEMPTALPNPNALTFTGAATGTYDGSAPLTVNIPAGGGGGGSSDKWELINTITVSDDATTNVTFTQDSAGNPFALKKLYLKISGISGGQTYPVIRLNGLHWTQQFGGAMISPAVNMSMSVLFELLGNGIYMWEWANTYGRDIRRTGERAPQGGTQSLIETINSVMWLWGTNSAITNGSVFTLYGVRA